MNQFPHILGKVCACRVSWVRIPLTGPRCKCCCLTLPVFFLLPKLWNFFPLIQIFMVATVQCPPPLLWLYAGKSCCAGRQTGDLVPRQPGAVRNVLDTCPSGGPIVCGHIVWLSSAPTLFKCHVILQTRPRV